MKFVIYTDNGGHHHWRLDAADGTVLAVSGTSFGSEAAAREAAVRVHDHAGSAGGTEH
jgi:uncharacterized protein YegP (UPF0339 family)